MQEVRKLLRDDQWKKLEPLLPGKAGDRGATAQDNRLFIEAVLWIIRTGSPWRDLPAELDHWHTTYTRFKRWTVSGVWQGIIDVVSGDRDMEILLIDSTVVRAHQHAAGAQKRRLSVDRSFARRFDEQDSGGGCTWQSGALVADRR